MKINKGRASVQTSRGQNDLIFALDIGTRSIIGLVGVVRDEKLHVLAIDKEEHTRRAMIDGQIEDIEQVAKVAQRVKERLEDKVECRLTNVCVAAAGRALKTQKAFCEMEFEKAQRVDEETIGRLEAGALEKAEEAFAQEMDQEGKQFFLVGYTVTQYLLDNYPISDLLDHQGRRISADVIATFLPSEVVESLYTTMSKVDLEVASLTLEPIAAINAAIPENIRLLNLALVDIGAGTSDIAISKDGSIVGYTMATVAGDEITEAVMKNYLVDFQTAEYIKMQIQEEGDIEFTDILGLPHTVTNEEVRTCIDGAFKTLCKEISEKILLVNGNAPSAVFLAGGGSKLADMQECVSKYLEMDQNRVAIAGNNFSVNAVSDEYDLNNPEYATPLGIAVSAGLNMINDSCHVMLNGKRSKLFRSGSLTVLDILMMNGYRSQDLLARSGRNVVIQLDGKRKIFHGTPGVPSKLQINGNDAKVSQVVHAGDQIHFTPASDGENAKVTLADIVEPGYESKTSVNGKMVPLDTVLKTGDVVITGREEPDKPEQPKAAAEAPVEEQEFAELEPPTKPEIAKLEPKKTEAAKPKQKEMNKTESRVQPAQVQNFVLNGEPLLLVKKENNTPYYLMDLLEYSGIDLKNPEGVLQLRVNGQESYFQQELKTGDRIDIYLQKNGAEDSKE